MADILSFPGNPGAPVQVFDPERRLPRSGFGLRKAEALAGSFGETLNTALGRIEDRTQQERIKQAARAARDASEGKAHVCPSLRKELAAEIGAIAKLCAVVAESAHGIGELRVGALLTGHQGLLETLAAEVE